MKCCPKGQHYCDYISALKLIMFGIYYPADC